jgi:hypothetical protein
MHLGLSKVAATGSDIGREVSLTGFSADPLSDPGGLQE